MQMALFKRGDTKQLRVALDRELPGHGTGVLAEAANDGEYHQALTPLRMTLSVLGNVLGGSLLLAGLYFLPQVLAIILH